MGKPFYRPPFLFPCPVLFHFDWFLCVMSVYFINLSVSILHVYVFVKCFVTVCLKKKCYINKSLLTYLLHNSIKVQIVHKQMGSIPLKDKSDIKSCYSFISGSCSSNTIIRLIHCCVYSLVVYLPGAETAEVTPDCWAERTSMTKPPSHNYMCWEALMKHRSKS